MTTFRRSLLLSGVAGLLTCTGIAALAVGLVTTGVVKPPLPHSLVVLALVVILGGLSVAEVPLMVFALRRLSAEGRGTRRLVQGLHALYVSFPGVYAAPVPLMTGDITWGLLLSSLAIPRLLISLLLVRAPTE